MKKLSAIILMLVISVIFISAIRPKTSTVYIYDVFDTYSEITVTSNKINPEYEEYLRRLDNIWNTTKPDSEINRISSEYTALSPETLDILKKSIEYSEKTNGYFDVTVGNSSALWNEAISSGILPTEEDIVSATKNVKPISIEGNTAFSDGAGITLGAIAKGYASDRLVEKIRKDSITSALINLGGNIYAVGTQNNSKPWKIGICDPFNPDSVVGAVEVTDSAVVTSGDYIRYIDVDGVRYHHIINPKSGIPANSGLKSVTIISKSGTDADVLSTACFVSGLEDGISLVKQFDALAIFITDNMEVYYSENLPFSPEGEAYNFKIIK